MKTFRLLTAVLFAALFFTSCKKTDNLPSIQFNGNTAEGKANNNGEFTLGGQINSTVRLDKVTLTREGQSTPFLVDESTAKNKTDYSYSYPVTGIMADTYVVIEAYNQEGGRSTARFLIRR